MDTTSDVFPPPSRVHANNRKKTDPPPALQGDFSDPKEQLMFSKPRRNLFSKIEIAFPSSRTFERVTRHAFRKREIDVNMTFAVVPKLNLG